MDKLLIKLLIKENQEKILKMSFIERTVELEPNFNYVFVGLRRSGKTFLMYQQIQNLLKNGHSIEEILFFNFEDDRIDKIELPDLDLIKRCYEEIYDYAPIFFLDEIQIVDRWEKFARRLADNKYRVYITGSNAKMLSGDVATTLGGRYLIHDVFPFSFNEYLLAHNIDLALKNEIYAKYYEIQKLYTKYFYEGGMPELQYANDPRGFLSSLYQKIYLGDICKRHQIRNNGALNFLIKKMAESVKQPASYTRFANLVSSLGTKVSTTTVIEYINHIKDSWLIFSVENYVAKMANKEANKKYYFVDNGLLNLFLLNADTSLLENQVAIKLRQLYGEQVYYLKGKNEIDFYLPAIQTAIQVSYSIKDFDTRKREIGALIELSKSNFEIKKYLLITKEEEEIITEQGIEIQVIPVLKWLVDMYQNL
ncbi:MAG: ATP-binding protein [Dysgonamonadaceae bacterium]|jgi:predicted AAA+ superfamily ATPase|nr:ATP-binding protein [Dysgonamonadaceae bacterium]